MKILRKFYGVIIAVFLVIAFLFAQQNIITVDENGNVGIGTTIPKKKLEVIGDTRIEGGLSLGTPDANGYGQEGWITYGGTPRSLIIMGAAGRPMSLGANNNPNFLFIERNGNVGIGTKENTAKLHIRAPGGDKGVRPIRLEQEGTRKTWDINIADRLQFIYSGSRKFEIGEDGSVYQNTTKIHTPDYVFEPDFELESIEEHSEYMWKEKHLKAIPKSEVDENGQKMINVTVLQRGILEELEKSHIYIEQLHKRIKILETKIEELSKKKN